MSLKPGSNVVFVEVNAIGSLSQSETMNPPTPVEYGRAVTPVDKAKTDDADGKLPYAT